MIPSKQHEEICNRKYLKLFLLLIVCTFVFNKSYAQYYDFKTEEFYKNQKKEKRNKKKYNTSSAKINDRLWYIETDGEISPLDYGFTCLKVGKSKKSNKNIDDRASYLKLRIDSLKSKIYKLIINSETSTNSKIKQSLNAEVHINNKIIPFHKEYNYNDESHLTFSIQNIECDNNLEIEIKFDEQTKYFIAIESIEIVNGINHEKDNSTTITSNKDIENNIIQVTRTLSKDYWNTFCLPFDVNEDSVKLHLNNPELREFTGKVNGTTMLFKDTTAIKAGVPYIIKPTKDVVNPIFRNVVITAVEPKEITDNTGIYAFVGAYSPTELKTDGTEFFLGDKDYLYKPLKDDNKIKGMRAFFRIKDASQAKQSQYGISIDGTTTITLPNTKNIPSTTQEKIYTLDGRQVHSTHNLKSGIYIKNGKKIYIN